MWKLATRTGLLFAIVVVITGLRLVPDSPLASALHFGVKEPLKAANKVTTFVRGIIQELDKEHETARAKEHGGSADHQSRLVFPDTSTPALAVVPSRDREDRVTVIARAGSQITQIDVSREHLEALVEKQNPPNHVPITFMLDGRQHTTLISKDMLIRALIRG